MIKVIASDMDGTLLNNNHAISERTLNAIHKACEKGFRFMIVTGRNFVSAMQELQHTDLVCDYIVSSGAEVRDRNQKVLKNTLMTNEECRFVNQILDKYPLPLMYCAEDANYMVGTKEEVDEGILDYIRFFHLDMSKEELKKTRLYEMMWAKTRLAATFEDLKRLEVPISKIFLSSEDIPLLQKVKAELEANSNLAVTSSFPYNLEITDAKAQKGSVLKEYIEELGYTMEEVMVLGDSLNDYSMLSMDFGATIAMANADPVIKEVSKYETLSNEEDGVAYVIEEMLKQYEMQSEKEDIICQ